MVPNVWQVHRIQQTFASIASNGANGLIAFVGPLGFDGRIRSFQAVFTGADQASAAASYRRMTVVNGGTGGAGTTILASVDHVGTAAIGSLSSGRAGTVVYPATGTAASLGTFGSNHVLQFSQITVGGAETNATVLRAGYFELMVESIG